MVLAQEVVIVCLCLKDTEIHATSKQGNTTNSALESLHSLHREQVAKQSIHVEFVSTHDNIADIMTKALPEPKVNLFVDAMRLRA